MESVLLDEDLLTRVFGHLSLTELRVVCAVCRKWRRCVRDCNHRGVSPEVFRMLKDTTNPRSTPLKRYYALQRNLLNGSDFATESIDLTQSFGPGRWKLTKMAPFVTADIGDAVGCSNKCFVFWPADERFMVGQLTQIVLLKDFLMESDLSESNAEKLIDECPPIRLFAIAWTYPQESTDETVDDRMAVTVALDDGTPILAPYQNNTMTAYTREALHVQEFTLRPKSMASEELHGRIEGYPEGVRRLIISFTFYKQFAIPLSQPALYLAFK